jgi:hypothetical protein
MQHVGVVVACASVADVSCGCLLLRFPLVAALYDALRLSVLTTALGGVVFALRSCCGVRCPTSDMTRHEHRALAQRGALDPLTSFLVRRTSDFPLHCL